MIRTIEKRVRVFHSVEICTGVFDAAPYQMPSLRLLTHVGFLRQNGLILSEVFFVYGKKQESRKKILP